MSSPLQELTSWFKKKKNFKNHASQLGKPSVDFPFYWTEGSGSSEGTAEQKPNSKALNCSLKVVFYQLQRQPKEIELGGWMLRGQ